MKEKKKKIKIAILCFCLLLASIVFSFTASVFAQADAYSCDIQGNAHRLDTVPYA